MTPTLAASSGTTITAVIIALVVVVVVIRLQVIPRPVTLTRQFILPAVLVILGIISLSNVTKTHPVTSTAGAYLALDFGTSAASGFVRGSFVRIFERNGVLWRQGGVLAIVLWVISIAIRAVVAVLADRAGVATVSNAALDAAFGVSLAVQFAVVSWRGYRRGIPFASPAPRR